MYDHWGRRELPRYALSGLLRCSRLGSYKSHDWGSTRSSKRNTVALQVVAHQLAHHTTRRPSLEGLSSDLNDCLVWSCRGGTRTPDPVINSHLVTKDVKAQALLFQIPPDGQLTRFEREGPLSASAAAAVVPQISRRTTTDAITTSISSGSNCVPLHFWSSAITTSTGIRFL
jgi:hypothetical protein